LVPDLNHSSEHSIGTLNDLDVNLPDVSVLRGGIYTEQL
jgi:hypothetical protein